MDTLLHRDALSRFGYALSDSTRTRVLLSLRGYELVVAVPEGRQTRYEFADPRIGDTLGQLMDLVLAVDPTLCPKSDEGYC